MSLESHRTSVFTFQSSVHSSHVLCCLDEQRQKDFLCDVTVVVENQSFRAHRSILASCSDYFSARMSGHMDQGLMINLPDEVTAEGFEPLLQFAYTSKLLFTKENVLEIRNCATFLGFKNLDNACFDFLLPKFFESSKSSSKGLRKQCCKTKCWRSKVESTIMSNGAIDAGDTSSLPSHNMSGIKDLASSKLGENGKCRTETCTKPEVESILDYSLLCPKYRKFQLACGKSLSCMDPDVPAAENNSACPLNCLPCISSGDCEDAVSNKDSPGGNKEDTGVSFYCPLAIQSPTEAPLSLCSETISVQKEPTKASCLTPAPSVGETVESPAARLSNKEIRVSNCCTGADCPSPSGALRADQRSSVEIEVANQLTSWPDICSSRALAASPVLARKPSELHCWRKLGLGTTAVDCPFLRDLGAVDAQVRGSERPSPSAGSPYVSSVHSGEDSDSFDTEGDSESYTSERASEMQLPFAVDRIASLSRNDFQQLLKTYCLSREQLDFVHDVRRRCKNRIAARRCRKRKLDCIHNLEFEIERLRNEKEKLTAEKQQLDQLKLKTWQSYSGLYEKLCAEANLQPEQVQVFAKYTSLADCAFTAQLSTTCFYHCPETELQPLATGLDADSVSCEPRPSTSSVLEALAGGAKVNIQSPKGLLAAPPDLHLADSPHEEEGTMTSTAHICPDHVNKLETDQ